MKRIYRIASKVIISGIIGILLILLSIYLIGIVMPHGDRPDVVEGWAAGLYLIIALAFAMLLTGAIGMFLAYDDISSSIEILAFPLLSGSVVMIIPFLIIVLYGLSSIGLWLYAMGLFMMGMVCILISLILSMMGGLAVYIVLSHFRPRAFKD